MTKLLTWRDGPKSMTELVQVALRLDPDRLVIGEVRGPEALDFIKAANTGLPGGLLTVHANSAEENLDRLDALAQEAGVPPQPARVEAAVDQVVQMGRERRVVGAPFSPSARSLELSVDPCYYSSSLTKNISDYTEKVMQREKLPFTRSADSFYWLIARLLLVIGMVLILNGLSGLGALSEVALADPSPEPKECQNPLSGPSLISRPGGTMDPLTGLCVGAPFDC